MNEWNCLLWAEINKIVSHASGGIALYRYILQKWTIIVVVQVQVYQIFAFFLFLNILAHFTQYGVKIRVNSL